MADGLSETQRAAVVAAIKMFDEEILKSAAILRGVPDVIWKMVIDAAKTGLREFDEMAADHSMSDAEKSRAKETGSAYLELCLAAQSFRKAGESYAGVKIKNMIIAREETRAREEG